jgi:hypothetical protein
MANRVRKITPEILKQIIVQEAKKIQKEAALEKAKRPEDVDADEVEADEYADALENKIDHYKALKVREAKLQKTLEQIKEAKLKIRKTIQKAAK